MVFNFTDVRITDEIIRSNFTEKDLNKTYSSLEVSYNNKTPRLCDYYITGSYGSYSCTNTVKSNTNCKVYLKKIIQSGIRAIHLDLYSNDNDSEVMVRGEDEKDIGENFEDVCSIVNNYIESDETLSEYPFILYLNLKYEHTRLHHDLSNKIANCLKKYFNDKFPDIRYNFNRYKIGREYITNFKNKVIILLNRFNNSKTLDELTHGIVYDEVSENNEHHITSVRFGSDNISSINKVVNGQYNMNSQFGNKDKVIKKTKEDIIIVYTDDDIYFNMNSSDDNSSKEYGINICMNKFKIKDGLKTVTLDYMSNFRDGDGDGDRNYQPFMLKPKEYMNEDEPLTIERINPNKKLQTDLKLDKPLDFGNL
jgi:hypothetical protein